MGNKIKTGSIIVKIGLLVGFVILVLVIIAIYKETNKKKQIQSVIDSLKTESERIVKSNSTMQEKIDFFSSNDYIESEARDKLNLKSPDEQVVVVKPSISKEIVEAEPAQPVQREAVAIVASHLKWWNYFFKY